MDEKILFTFGVRTCTPEEIAEDPRHAVRGHVTLYRHDGDEKIPMIDFQTTVTVEELIEEPIETLYELCEVIESIPFEELQEEEEELPPKPHLHLVK